jgi:hypothetical protein
MMQCGIKTTTRENRMMKLTGALALALALAGAQHVSAASFNTSFNGNACFSVTPGVAINYSQWGPYNTSTTTGITVNCPVQLPSQNYTSASVLVSGWSRNSSANKLSCTLRMTGYDGYSQTSATATIAYNTAVAGTTNATLIPIWQAPWPYLTCYIPPNNGNGISYLSTIYVSGSY